MKVMMPESLMLPAGVTSSMTAPIRSSAVITGTSLVPVMVTVPVPPVPPELGETELTVGAAT